MIYYPFCDGQGLIHKAAIKGTDITLYICDECDTVCNDLEITENNCYSLWNLHFKNRVLL